jgi:hypothetical protein
MIRIEHPDNWGCEEKFTCPVTGKNFETADELNESLKRFPHLRHRDRDEDSIAAGKDEKIALLEQTIAEMRSEMRTFMAAHAIRGRGRPRKSEAENDLDEGTENGESDS